MRIADVNNIISEIRLRVQTLSNKRCKASCFKTAMLDYSFDIRTKI